MAGTLHIFGIRHHGPGCARSLRAALEQLQPDAVMVEGPPDAGELLSLVAHPEMRPPVALLLYPEDDSSQAVFYPFAEFSPEWQALRWGWQNGAEVRCIDLPQTHQLAVREQEEEETGEGEQRAAEEEEADSDPEQAAEDDERWQELREDPVGALAAAAGFEDREGWWESQIEMRRDAQGLFAGILEAMQALRGELARPPSRHEQLREAYMRRCLRQACKQHQRVAVVCGAWHAPALAELGPAAPDNRLLKGLPKRKLRCTWIPWSHSRLASRSGYGAGVSAPGWYRHLWQSESSHSARWLTRVAQLLRAQQLDTSTAHVIEAVRLADALAALRDLPQPGLAELQEAARAVMCQGSQTPLALIREQLEIAETFGEVPDEAPQVPLQREFARLLRSLRFGGRSRSTPLELDLRKEQHRAKSNLIHRLGLLEIPWGQAEHVRSQGTFKEVWRLQWQPEFELRLIEASVHGQSIAQAAEGALIQKAREAEALPALSELLQRCVPAELPGAVDVLIQRIGDVSALAADVVHLMDALLPLARLARYGDVRLQREEASARLLPVIEGMLVRVHVGLPVAWSSLDDDAAARLLASLDRVQASLALLERPEQLAEWRELLAGQLENEGVHGLLRGRFSRWLLEAGALEEQSLARLARLALNRVAPAASAGSWIEGLVGGSGMLLLHQPALWQALDAWLVTLGSDDFVELLPVLRRAFADFSGRERRDMGALLARLAEPKIGEGGQAGPAGRSLSQRARQVLPVLAQLLGGAQDG